MEGMLLKRNVLFQNTQTMVPCMRFCNVQKTYLILRTYYSGQKKLQWVKCFFFSDFNRERSLGQGNVFIPVCHSVHGGGGGSPTGRGLHLGEEGSAYRGTASKRVGQTPPQLEKRAVCILLECFIVFLYF